MNRIFISYSGNRTRRAALFFALREHGLNPWRDVENLDLGGDTTDVIEAELAGCSGVILWIDDNMLASEYVARVELPAIAKASRSGLRLAPVFDGVSPGDASERISALGIEIGDSNGHVVDGAVGDEVTAAAIAREYVRAHVQDARDREVRPVVRLVSYDDTAGLLDEAVLNLDWRHQLASGSVDDSGEDRMRAALTAATGAVKDVFGACEITLAVKAHLPLAVALGHAFAEPTGCTLRLPESGGAWTVSRSAPHAQPLDEHQALKGPVDAEAATVEVSVSRDVEAGVNAHVGAGNRYRHRVMLAPHNGPGRDALSGSNAMNVWARQVGESIMRVRDKGDVKRVDLFLATPVELAIAVGWWANASGPIGLMNWTGKSGPYERMWTLS